VVFPVKVDDDRLETARTGMWALARIFHAQTGVLRSSTSHVLLFRRWPWVHAG
jgi:hypothetical protein